MANKRLKKRWIFFHVFMSVITSGGWLLVLGAIALYKYLQNR